MKLVERHIIKSNHRFYSEIDRLCFASKNLYNFANYLIRQAFIFENTYLNYNTVQKTVQGTEPYQALPEDSQSTNLNGIRPQLEEFSSSESILL